MWRLFGIVLIQYVTIQAQDYNWAAFMGLPRGLHWTGLAGLMLALAGARLICLVIAAGVLLSYLVPIYTYVVTLQVSEEYLLFLCLPLTAILLSVIVMLTHTGNDARGRETIDDAHCALFRLSAVMMMGFAAFHKINSDFLNPNVSCAAGLFANLSDWWNIPFVAVVQGTPLAMGIVTEALVPVLLLLCPPLGLIYTILLMAFIGLLGATAFTLIVIVMACGFFRHEDGALIAEGFAKYKWIIAGVAVVTAVTSYFSYSGQPHWFGFLLFQTTVLLVWFAAVLPVWKGVPWGDFPRLFPGPNAVRFVLIVYFIAGVVNGLSPYFGWKYRSSFAMLSNLRVDRSRWNHLLVPESFFMREHDHFIRITKVDMNHVAYQRQQAMGRRVAKEGMLPGLVSPMSLALRLKRFNGEGIQVDLYLTYQGTDYIFEDATNNLYLKAWLADLPHNKLFQEWLVAEGPQPCYH